MHKITVNTKYIKDTEAVVYAKLYGNGSTALLISDLNGERLFTATVALEETPQKGFVFIKDWSENEGVLQCLIDQGVIRQPVREIKTGFVYAFECQLMI